MENSPFLKLRKDLQEKQANKPKKKPFKFQDNFKGFKFGPKNIKK